jgi:hypothetical protein
VGIIVDYKHILFLLGILGDLNLLDLVGQAVILSIHITWVIMDESRTLAPPERLRS